MNLKHKAKAYTYIYEISFKLPMNFCRLQHFGSHIRAISLNVGFLLVLLWSINVPNFQVSSLFLVLENGLEKRNVYCFKNVVHWRYFQKTWVISHLSVWTRLYFFEFYSYVRLLISSSLENYCMDSDVTFTIPKLIAQLEKWNKFQSDRC